MVQSGRKILLYQSNKPHTCRSGSRNRALQVKTKTTTTGAERSSLSSAIDPCILNCKPQIKGNMHTKFLLPLKATAKSPPIDTNRSRLGPLKIVTVLNYTVLFKYSSVYV
ncbi:WD repeat-containing protein 61 [Platysternon megacephalum]|uniref:WD repeat-containing protein 61 n=1 Tax=Platysternon megacephalum TaxID=55544 RepID=A0A4D9DV65_9SAUR|nr:WD repeat-containing protein 61 [Platysternon megacephalum]